MMKTQKEQRGQCKEIFGNHQGILRASKAIELGVPKHVIYDLVQTGELIKESRGLYRLAEAEPLANPDLIQASLLIPKGIIFLISALYFHKLTTQIPHLVYIAVPQKTKKPRITYPPFRFFYFSEKQYLAGIQKHTIDGIEIRIYDKEKTITDCFKYRNQIGMDIAIEALKDYMRQPSPNIHLLMEYAAINRIEKLIRPYVEILQ